MTQEEMDAAVSTAAIPTPEVKEATVAEAPKTEVVKEKTPAAPTIKVNSAPNGKTKKTTAEIQKDRREWVAKHRAEQKDILKSAGYTDIAILQIMKYASGHTGYEKRRAKDHLILVFEHLANDLKFRLQHFDRDMSANLVVALIDVNGKLQARLQHGPLDPAEVLAGKSDEEKMKIAQQAISSSLGNSDSGKAMARAVCYSVNNKFVEGYAERVKFFCDAAVDCSMKGVDPFEGMFHDEPLESPEWMKPKKQFTPRANGKPCPKCGKPMQHVFKINKDFCLNPLCEDYAPPPEKKEFHHRGDSHAKKGQPEKISLAHEHTYTSGKKFDQVSAADKFRQRYAKKPLTPEQKAHAEKKASERKAINDSHKQAEKFVQAASSSVWGALDALKLGDVKANEAVPTAQP